MMLILLSKKILIIMMVAVSISTLSIGIVYGMNHINYDDPDWECKKWIGIVELAKQNYPNFVEDTLTMAEMKCGFDVDEFT